MLRMAMLIITILTLITGLFIAWSDEPSMEIPKYKIIEVNDVSWGTIKRYDIRVSVDHILSLTELNLVSKNIIEKFKATKPHNAIMIFYFLPDSDIKGVYTAGKAIWAPFGDWERADESLTGKYSKHKFSLSLGNATGIAQEKVMVQGIPIEQKKKIFYSLVEAQDRRVGANEAYVIIGRKYKINESIVRRIALEGITMGWPKP